MKQLWPLVGEDTLRDLAAEAQATESRRKEQIRTTLASSYTSYYRTMLPKLLEALALRLRDRHSVGRRRFGVRCSRSSSPQAC